MTAIESAKSLQFVSTRNVSRFAVIEVVVIDNAWNLE